MKMVIGFILAFVTSFSAFAADAKITCKLNSMKIEIISNVNTDEKTAVFTQGRQKDSRPLVKEQHLTRGQISGDSDLLMILGETGLTVENILSGTAYITEINNVGKAGLVVFRAARQEIMGKVWFASYAGYLEVCK